MATWIVRHVITGQNVGEHGTKKAATAQADEMTGAHEAINAKHEGQSVAFVAVKVDDAPPPAEQPESD